MQLKVNETFFHNDTRYLAGLVIDVTPEQLKAEIDKGFHPNPPNKDNGRTDPRKVNRHLSGLIIHCSPADDATAAFISKAMGKEVPAAKEEKESEGDSADELAAIYKELDGMGAAYDKRWGIQKARNELIKAKKNRGL